MAQDVRAEPSASAPPSPLRKITYEEFLNGTDEDTRAEWVDGQVIALSPVSEIHDDLAGFLLALIRFFTEAHQLGRVCHEPFQVSIGSYPSVRTASTAAPCWTACG